MKFKIDQPNSKVNKVLFHVYNNNNVWVIAILSSWNYVGFVDLFVP